MVVGTVVGVGRAVVPVGAVVAVGLVVAVGVVTGRPLDGLVVGVDVGSGVEPGAGGVMLHPVAPAAGAPAVSQAVSVAISLAPSRALGGGGMGFVSLAMRSAAMLATVRLALLFAEA